MQQKLQVLAKWMYLSSSHDKDKVHFQDVANILAVFQNKVEGEGESKLWEKKEK